MGAGSNSRLWFPSIFFEESTMKLPRLIALFFIVAFILMNGRAIASDLPIGGSYLKIPGLPGDMSPEGNQEEYLRVEEWNWKLFRNLSRKRTEMCPLGMSFMMNESSPVISLVNALASGTLYPEAALTFTSGHKTRDADEDDVGAAEEALEKNQPFSIATTVYTFSNVQIVEYATGGSAQDFLDRYPEARDGVPEGTMVTPQARFTIAFETVSAQVVPIAGTETESGTYTINGPRTGKKRFQRSGCSSFDY